MPRVHPKLSAAPLVRLRVPLALGLLCLLAACSSGYGPTAHRHGGAFASPARYYPPPGPAEDPWGPYIREASGRYGVPEQWIREVMRQESGGQEQAVSSAGAMGLMQIMPDTFDGLRRRYALGNDPFEPRDNIMAGTAYIREMYAATAHPAFSRRTMQGRPVWTATSSAATRCLMKPSITSLRSRRVSVAVYALTGPLAAYGQDSNMALVTLVLDRPSSSAL